jgi:hypothetical protein
MLGRPAGAFLVGRTALLANERLPPGAVPKKLEPAEGRNERVPDDNESADIFFLQSYVRSGQATTLVQ